MIRHFPHVLLFVNRNTIIDSKLGAAWIEQLLELWTRHTVIFALNLSFQITTEELKCWDSESYSLGFSVTLGSAK